MSGNNKISLTQAESFANRVVAELAPGCERIVIAGSIRRSVPVVGDIEIVAIPRFDIAPISQMMLLDVRPPAVVSALDVEIERLLKEKPSFERGAKNGEKYKNFVVNGGIKIDLFITTPPQWGIILAIRTGAAAFSQALVTARASGGLLPDGYKVADGWLWYRGAKVATPEERNVFEVCGGWVEPERRSAWRPNTIMVISR